ncbi:hypothetical protein MRB53_025133 [Persea americana]|uniref:Uncharacterized protein n=1 Tax=Persea americana TaxID=3435 RepID=A0ACC2LEP1_PERAE|nr:hypothetical protein MRB53_025133 [Persea americana]
MVKPTVSSYKQDPTSPTSHTPLTASSHKQDPTSRPPHTPPPPRPAGALGAGGDASGERNETVIPMTEKGMKRLTAKEMECPEVKNLRRCSEKELVRLMKKMKADL